MVVYCISIFGVHPFDLMVVTTESSDSKDVDGRALTTHMVWESFDNPFDG